MDLVTIPFIVLVSYILGELFKVLVKNKVEHIKNIKEYYIKSMNTKEILYLLIKLKFILMTY